MALWNQDAEKKKQPETLLKRMRESMIITAEGTAGFQGIFASNTWTLLNTMLELHKDIPQTDGRRLMRQALQRVANTGDLTAADVLSELNTLERDYLKQPSHEYILFTSLSIRWLHKLDTVNLDGTTIIFDRTVSPALHDAAAPLVENAKRRLFGRLPTDYLPLRVQVSARTPHAAAEKALGALDLLRSIWNLHLNRPRTGLWTNRAPEPVNEIVLGPIHTLHFPDGSLAAPETWWYSPEYVGPVKPYDFLGNYEKTMEFYARVVPRLQQCSYQERLKIGLRRYVQALDERHADPTFLRLWSLLEYLTNTGNGSYDVTVRRAARLFEDYEHHLVMLDQLRVLRNRAIHSDDRDPEIDQLMYVLKLTVEHLLTFHLFNAFGFESMEDVGKFLDLPHSEAELRKRSRLLESALTFHGYASGTSTSS